MSLTKSHLGKVDLYRRLIIGTAVGDAIGLPREGLSPKRARKLFGNQIQPALIVIPFIKRLSVCSDDTEHLWLTAQALLKTQSQDVDAFEAQLANQLKKWILTLPVGAGMATLKACIKLLCGISPKKSGIYSAGNGPVMRAVIIGSFYANDTSKMQAVLKASTLITHKDNRAYEGAWIIAKASALLTTHNPLTPPTSLFFDHVLPHLKNKELRQNLELARQLLCEQKSLTQYLSILSLNKKGISGYTNHTVPAVIYAWLRYFGNYQETVEQLIKAGGDTDTTAAIAGALTCITTGTENIPPHWLVSIHNAPMSLDKLGALAHALANQAPAPAICWPVLLLRNLGFLGIVLLHGFRRLLPPY